MFLKKQKLGLSYDPAIPILVIYLKDSRESYSRDTCSSMVTDALIPRKWKQPRYPTDEWIMKCGTCSQWNLIDLFEMKS